MTGSAFIVALLLAPTTSPTAQVSPAAACVGLCAETREALRSPAAEVRRTALLRFTEGVDRVAKQGRSREEKKRATAQMVKPLQGEIIAASADDDDGVRRLAATLMRFLPAQTDVLDALVRLATETNREVRYPALTSLATVGRNSAETHQRALEWLGSGDPVRFEAGAFLVGQLHLAQGIPVLIGALGTTDPVKIRDASLALAKFGNQAASAVPALTSALERLKRASSAATPDNKEASVAGPFPASAAEACKAVEVALRRIQAPATPGSATPSSSLDHIRSTGARVYSIAGAPRRGTPDGGET